jgi:hypothetical protein
VTRPATAAVEFGADVEAVLDFACMDVELGELYF